MRHVARRTAVLRGRTTADWTDVAAGRGCKNTHALVHEGIPGRVINRSRRGSTRNTVKTLEDRIEAPRLFAAVPPQMCRELGAESWLFTS